MAVWGASVGAVVLSAAVAWLEGNWVRRSGLSMGFANHGGMWGDLLLLPIANALVVPQLTLGSWLPVAFALSAVASVLVHVHWYRGHKVDAHRGAHVAGAPAGSVASRLVVGGVVARALRRR